MLRSYIESRERFLHQRDKNRRPLPFDWGLEHIGLPSDGDPHAMLRDYVYRALSDSESFYAYAPTQDYNLEGNVLKFPSAVETPVAVNNTVCCQLFEAGNRERAVVVLPQWNAKWQDVRLCKELKRFGVTALRLSLPYHDSRKPDHLERSDYLVAPNVGLTLASTRQAVLDARRAMDWLIDRGYRSVGIVGTSIGSCVAFLTYAHEPRFATGVFIHVSGFFADVVWTGLSTSHVRESLESAVSLERLRFYWSPISPYPFIKRLRGTRKRILMLAGRYDLTFLPGLSQMAFDEFSRNRVPHDLALLSCGHYTMGELPFNWIAGAKIVRFLRRIL